MTRPFSHGRQLASQTPKLTKQPLSALQSLSIQPRRLLVVSSQIPVATEATLPSVVVAARQVIVVFVFPNPTAVFIVPAFAIARINSFVVMG